MSSLRGFIVCLFVLSIFSVGFLSPVPAHAQLIPCNGIDCKVDDLTTLAVNIYNFLLGLAAVVAILIIVLSGVGMLTYHWFENPDQVLQGAKYTLTRAVAGFIIIAMAYLIVNTLLVVVLGVNQGGGVGDLLKEAGIF